MPSFKSNLDIQQNQLLNAVLHRCSVLPEHPVEGQVYYNDGKHLAYLWDGTSWIPWGGYSGGVGNIAQFTLNIPNPAVGTSMAFSRLYQELSALRVDAHFSTNTTVYFDIDIRQNVNMPGTNITDQPMQATFNATETTIIDHSFLNMDYWLVLTVVREGEGATSGEGEIPGLLTVVITCSIG